MTEHQPSTSLPPTDPLPPDTPASAPVEGEPASAPPYRRPPNLLPLPYFSLAERARRWDLVQAAMERRGVDCLVVPSSGGRADGLQAATRYLTLVGGGATDATVVLPAGDEPTVFVPTRDQWVGAQPWCQDIRAMNGSFSEVVAERLRELPLPRRRVGVVGLRAHHGGPTHSFVEQLAHRVTGCNWIDLGPDIDAIRFSKSAEELAFLERATRIVDQAYATVTTSLRHGLSEREVWASAVEAVCAGGGDLPLEWDWAAGHEPVRRALPLAEGRIEPGWMVVSAIDAAWGGYRARGAQPIVCGPPPRPYPELSRLLADVWNETVRQLRPGLTLEELAADVERIAQRLRPRQGPGASTAISLELRGCGLGDDPPRPGDPRSTRAQLRLAPNACVFLALAAARGPWELLWGDTIVITGRGCRRLGTRSPGLHGCHGAFQGSA